MKIILNLITFVQKLQTNKGIHNFFKGFSRGTKNGKGEGEEGRMG
jgi:hypothetical protein